MVLSHEKNSVFSCLWFFLLLSSLATACMGGLYGGDSERKIKELAALVQDDAKPVTISSATVKKPSLWKNNGL
jgi:hypothetical protein